MKSTDASVDGKVDCLVGGQQHTWYLSLWVGCIVWHKAARWAEPKNGSKWWWQQWWRPGNCNLHIYCPSFETRQSGQYLFAPRRRPLPIGTNASGGVILCCLSIVVNSHQASTSNGGKWNCLWARLMPGSRVFRFIRLWDSKDVKSLQQCHLFMYSSLAGLFLIDFRFIWWTAGRKRIFRDLIASVEWLQNTLHGRGWCGENTLVQNADSQYLMYIGDGHNGSLMLVQNHTSGLEGALLCWCWKDRWRKFSISVPSLSPPS